MQFLFLMDHLLADFSSSSSSSSVHGTQHDVFLNFRGDDTRNNFIGHLYRALQQKGIQTFIDNEELRSGEEISPSLIKAIRGSKISIIIFSKNYASSSWCLDELVEILECRELHGQLVWPVFLYVDPSYVRNHRGNFGEALDIFEERSNKNKEKLPKWKIALNRASNLSGWHLDKGNESELVQRIVEAAVTKLNRTPLHVAKYPVGIEDRLQDLEPLIDVAKKHVRFIGLYGMGGIGKTTIAKAVYNNYGDEFESSSFLANVRETSKQHLGFVQLQETLLLDMLGDKNLKVGNIHRGINIIRERLCNKTVLLILDDVDELDQLETLAGGHEWFGLGSRIIITTRNKHLLTTHGVLRTYEVEELEYERAVELFSWNAFKREKPVEHYLTLSDRIVCYASGLPLALVVLGSFLYGRKEDQWLSAIHNLERKPDKKLYEIMKISYDALQDDVRALFLDIACFFVGEDKDYVIKVLRSGNFCPIIGLEVLTDMSLINVENNRLTMHHLIEEVGKQIVIQESPEVGKQSRLWSPDDVFHIFSENTGTNLIEGIMLRLPEQRTLYMNAKSFKRMKRLRLLIFANVVLSTSIGFLSNELRLIDLPGYQFPNLPFNYGSKQLVILNMPHSHVHRLDKGFENFERLKVLNFSHSKFLNKIPDLSTAPNLECLYVDHCTSLVEMHESVGLLTKLITLDLRYCSNLSIFPRNLVSKYLRTLDFQGCSRLQNFPNIVEEMRSLRRLDLFGTAIEELPSSIELIVELRNLRLSACSEFMHIPSSIYKLQNLDVLDLDSCQKLIKSPMYGVLPMPNELLHHPKSFFLRNLILQNCNLSEVDFLTTAFHFPRLIQLDLSYNKFVSLPSLNSPMLGWIDLSNNKFLISLPSFQNLHKLSSLVLSKCELLGEIPDLPNCNMELEAIECKSLVETPCKVIAKIISTDQGVLRDSDIEATFSGLEIPDWFSHKLGKAITFIVPSNNEMEKTLLGNDIGGWFSHRFGGESITIDMPPNMLKNMSALIFCAAFKSASEKLELSIQLLDESDHPIGSLIREIHFTKPGNIWLIYLPARTIVCQCLSSSSFKDFRKIRVTFFTRWRKYSTKLVSSCGIHILQDRNEKIIDNKQIKVSHLSQNVDIIPHFV